MRLLKLIGLTIGGLALGLLLAEGLTRILLPYPKSQINLLRMRAPDLQMDAGTDLKNPNYNPFLQRRPFSEWVCDGKISERMNNEGFRDQDFNPIKNPNKVRIAILGDSFTEGWMGPREVAFPRILENELGSSVEVFNFGLANRSPLRYLALYDQIARKYHPDVVLVCLYKNDLTEDESLLPYVTFDENHIPRHFDYERYFRHTPRMPQTKWEKRRDKWQWYLCRHSRLYPHMAVWLTVDPDFRKRILEMPSQESFPKLWKNTMGYLESLKNEAQGDGVRIYLTYIPDLGDFTTPDRLHDILPRFADKNHIPYFGASLFLASTHSQALYIPGDGHFNAEGHRLYGGELAGWLKGEMNLR